jgi:hypothetical protein
MGFLHLRMAEQASGARHVLEIISSSFVEDAMLTSHCEMSCTEARADMNSAPG